MPRLFNIAYYSIINQIFNKSKCSNLSILIIKKISATIFFNFVVADNKFLRRNSGQLDENVGDHLLIFNDYFSGR